MIDREKIGQISEAIRVEVEAGQLRFFAKATGERNPVYTDENAAQAAGCESLPAPPTFAFTLSMARPDPLSRFTDLGIPLARLLHGEQSFDYSGPILAGDVITLQDRIVDVYQKQGGALEFIITETTGTNQRGETVVRMTETAVVRHGKQ
ncbi:MaoC family dehydratase N-terminal domain-containing protein [Hyphomonas sp.]|uniref:MaoC family dehydratase N-terminal domain-containing protein n=1 Tax=Hyphomonas sp. TaxID=87 RepID=UPI00391CAC7A